MVDRFLLFDMFAMCVMLVVFATRDMVAAFAVCASSAVFDMFAMFGLFAMCGW